jgi:ribulose bisphosphate carboxylase small subunit
VADTTYIVLRLVSPADEASWDYVRAIDAHNAEDAIRQVATNRTETSGTYVAVPARSWKPVQVTAVQTTTLKLEQPT